MKLAVTMGFAEKIADFLDGFLCPIIAAAHRKYNLLNGTMTHFEPKNIVCDAAVPLGEVTS